MQRKETQPGFAQESEELCYILTALFEVRECKATQRDFISSAQTTVEIETPPSECAYDLIFGCFSEILLNSYAFNFWKKKCLGKEVSMKNISAIWEPQLTERNRLFLIYVYKHTKWCWRTLDSPNFSGCNEESSPHNLTYSLSHTDWCHSPMEEEQ